MPIYEYRRPDGSTFEVLRSFDDPPLTEDPDTGVPVAQVLHAPAVHFKGKGFYNTDYGTRNRQRETAASSESSSSADSASGGTSDSSSKGDSKSGDSKGGDSKGGDSKGGDSKKSEPGAKSAARADAAKAAAAAS
jgi:putative FmdB family regulatory protein